MKCLTVCQPWAWAIVAAGKDVENRTWPTRHRGPLLIQAGMSRRFLWTAIEHPVLRTMEIPALSAMAFGAIVGICDVVGCCGPEVCISRWAEGPWCWQLANIRRFEAPIPYPGARGLFDVDPAELGIEEIVA